MPAWLAGAAILLVTTLFAGLGLCAFALGGDAGVRHAMATASPQDIGVTVAMAVKAENFAKFDQAVREQTDLVLEGVPSQVSLLLRSDGYAMPGQENLQYRRVERLTFDSFDGYQQHAKLISGSWPRSRTEPLEAAISQNAASLTGFAPGQEFTSVSRVLARPVRVKITGVFVPDDPYGQRWAGDMMIGRGVEREGYTTYGPLMVDQATFLDHFATEVNATWTVVPDLSGLSVERLHAVAARLPGLRDRFARSDCPDCTPFSDLPKTLTRLEAASTSARWTVLALTAVLALALLLAPRPRGMLWPGKASRPGGSARSGETSGPEDTARLGGVGWRAFTVVVVVGCALVAPFLARLLLTLAQALPWSLTSGMELPPAFEAGSLLPAMVMALAAAVLLLAQVPRPGVRALRVAIASCVAGVAICGVATWHTSQLDQARHQAGADLRLTGPPSGGEPGALGRGTAFAALPGITAAVPVHRDRIAVDLRNSTLLGIDATRLAEMFRLRPDLSDRTIAQLSDAMVAGRPRIGGLTLPGTPRTLTVEADSSADGLRLRMVISDALGVWHDVPVAPLHDGSNVVNVDLAALSGRSGKLAYPLTIRGFLGGAVDESPRTLTVTSIRADGGQPSLPADQRWSEGTDGAGLFTLKFTNGTGVVRPVPVQAAPDQPLPVVLTPELATWAKLTTGKTGTMALGYTKIPVRLVGIVERMPGAAVDSSGILVDGPTLQAFTLARALPPLPATDWWLATGDGSRASAAVSTSGWDATVIDPTDSPALPPGGLGEALALGLVTALALLLAAAATWRTLWYAAAGIALGLALCYAALPQLVRAWQGGTATPDVLLDIPWPAIIALFTLFAAITAIGRLVHARTPAHPGEPVNQPTTADH